MTNTTTKIMQEGEQQTLLKKVAGSAEILAYTCQLPATAPSFAITANNESSSLPFTFYIQGSLDDTNYFDIMQVDITAANRGETHYSLQAAKVNYVKIRLVDSPDFQEEITLKILA